MSPVSADHRTRSSRQLSPTQGSTNGIDSAEPSVAPITMPLVETAVPNPTCAGTQARTSAGSAGCMIATPNPIRAVVP